jgi:hypothetical protein
VRSSFSFVGTISSVGCDRGHSWYTRFPLSELFPLSDVIVAIRGCVHMRCTYTTYPDIRFTRFEGYLPTARATLLFGLVHSVGALGG